MHLGPGSTSYVAGDHPGCRRDRVDADLLAFLQCFARDLVKWEVILYFSAREGAWCSLRELARELDPQPRLIRRALVELAEVGLLEEHIFVFGPKYRLTQSPELRYWVVNLGLRLHWEATWIG